ncbi:MAG: putative surface protein with fasciclin (FAS1) repeats [Vicingaceae bacterium]|jgi:uncharacterized surface protein with fasciclin (FAS1) repeats
MKKITLILSLVTFSLASIAQNNDVVDIAISSENHTTLVAAVIAADLVETLKGEGPFTVFAPTNDAFDKLPEGTVATLLEAENKEKLTAILTYHVVEGNLMASDVLAAIKEGKGKVVLTTIQGGKLTASLDGDNVKLTDENGNTSFVTATDLKGSNGVVHVIDTVIMPK